MPINYFSKNIKEFSDLSKEVSRQISGKSTYGTINTLNPLSVRLDNNNVLTHDLLFLGQMLRPQSINAYNSSIGNITLEINPNLQIGDRVLLLGFNNNQFYYVAEKI